MRDGGFAVSEGNLTLATSNFLQIHKPLSSMYTARLISTTLSSSVSQKCLMYTVSMCKLYTDLE